MKNVMIALAVALLTMGSASVEAKSKVPAEVYVFGFAASFNDSTVYFTDVQRLDSAQFTRKTNLLRGRDELSYQLRDYMATKLGQKNRTCVTIYSTKRKDIEKKYLKMKRQYTVKSLRGYDVRYITSDMFTYSAVHYEDETTEDGKK